MGSPAIYDNKRCPICDQPHDKTISTVSCRRFEGTVCMRHCASCKYLSDWHCTYRFENDRKKMIAALYAKHGMKKSLAEDGKTNQEKTE